MHSTRRAYVEGYFSHIVAALNAMDGLDVEVLGSAQASISGQVKILLGGSDLPKACDIYMLDGGQRFDGIHTIQPKLLTTAYGRQSIIWCSAIVVTDPAPHEAAEDLERTFEGPAQNLRAA